MLAVAVAEKTEVAVALAVELAVAEKAQTLRPITLVMELPIRVAVVAAEQVHLLILEMVALVAQV
jgi:hypothetical protein